MFEVHGGAPPEGWEPIPDAVFDELGPWESPDEPAGMVPMIDGSDDLVWQAVGRALGSGTLGLIAAVPFEQLSDGARIQALRRLDELSGHVEAMKVQLTALIAGPDPVTARAQDDDYVAHEVGVATRCSVYSADRRIRLARDLASRLQAAATALETGRLTYPQAIALSEATGHLDIDLAREVEGKVLTYCHRQNLGLFNASVRRWLAKRP